MALSLDTLLSYLPDLVLVVACLLATATDLKARRIYDWITLPALALGLALALAQGLLAGGEPFSPLLSALGGALVGWGLFALMVLSGGMGGGDAKLMGAVGALLGLPAVVGAMLFVAIVGGVQGVLALLARTPPGRRLCAGLGMTGTGRPEFARGVPYGVAIALGSLAFRLWQRLPPGP